MTRSIYCRWYLTKERYNEQATDPLAHFNSDLALDRLRPDDVDADGARGDRSISHPGAYRGADRGPESAGLTTEASGTCAHPYFPARSDTAWTYDLYANGNPAGSYTLTFEDITDEGFTAKQSFDGELETEVRWLCGDDGLMTSVFANVSFAQLTNFEYETLEREGVVMLPEEAWQVGASWSTRYLVNATATIEGMTIDSQMDINLDHTLAAFEEVTVPAGTYEAARVDTTGSFRLTNPVEMEIDFPYSIWYVEGVGMVQVYGETESGSSRVELVSLTPLE